MGKLKSGMRGKNNGLLKLIKDLPDNIIMAEIGCYAGESSLMFLQSGKINKFYAVDPWDKIYKGDLRGRSEEDIKLIECVYGDMEWAEESFDIRMKSYCNVVKLKMVLEEALNKLPLLDFIYIDADHTYSAVLKDITLAKKIVKKNGIIAGHDYNRLHNGLKQAVNEMFKIEDIKFYPDSSWLVKHI